MESFVLIFLVFCLFDSSESYSATESEDQESVILSIARCNSDIKINVDQLIKEATTFDIGFGLDGLTDKPTSQLMLYDYSGCWTTNDGLELLPKGVTVRPVREQSSRYTHIKIGNYEDLLTSNHLTMAVDANIPFSFIAKIGGSFSADVLYVRQRMVQKQTNMDILKVKEVTRELIFTGKKYKLLPSVQNQLDEIKEALLLNDTALSKILMDLFISDYGTHIITKVELGVSIEEYLFSNSNSLYSNISIIYNQNLNARAKMLFQSNGNLKANYSLSDGKNIGSTSDDTRREIHQRGKLKPSTNENDGTYEVLMEAPLKYHVKPICTIIFNMELTSQYDRSRLKFLCENATATYYKVNEKNGCTDIKASNFDFQANSNTNCTYAEETPFGGLYSTIEADLREDYLFSKEINDSAKKYSLEQLKATDLKNYLNYVDGDIDVIYTYNLYWCKLDSRLTRFPTDVQQLYIDEVAQENTDSASDEGVVPKESTLNFRVGFLSLGAFDYADDESDG
ncbi:hypothetical protein WR25_24228 [Diploscapter pachys]|uniref:MACPF domain-containing protein n=1 Tax=Diploscapter pachys TaxID=2018661 RepID=A0A2A2LQP4_9BILA|nr:hypothetical protein WR25_24228 [Diploscapter pachys]